MRSAGRIVFGVLIASVVVAMLLAFQAITAARSRQAVREAMLRQYGQLAASEFARIARRDIETSLTRTLTGYIHPGRHAGDAPCNCAPLASVDYWFEVDILVILSPRRQRGEQNGRDGGQQFS